jgi:hypothetical protein
MDFFTNLLIKELNVFWVKLMLIPFSVLFFLYITQIIVLKLLKQEIQWNVHRRISLLISIFITLVVYNLFWILIIRNNGVDIFHWSGFYLTRNNIYLMLSPYFLGYLLLFLVYLRTEGQIKKTL